MIECESQKEVPVNWLVDKNKKWMIQMMAGMKSILGTSHRASYNIILTAANRRFTRNLSDNRL